MRFPDAVTIIRATGADGYGNPGSSWASPEEVAVRGFLSGEVCFFPPRTDVRRGDRLRLGVKTYDTDGDPDTLRSPSRVVALSVGVTLRRS